MERQCPSCGSTIHGFATLREVNIKKCKSCGWYVNVKDGKCPNCESDNLQELPESLLKEGFVGSCESHHSCGEYIFFKSKWCRVWDRRF